MIVLNEEWELFEKSCKINCITHGVGAEGKRAGNEVNIQIMTPTS